MLKLLSSWLIRLAGNGTALAVLLGLGAALYHGWRTNALENALQGKAADLAELKAEREGWRNLALAYEARANKLQAMQRAADTANRELQRTLAARQTTHQQLASQIRHAPPDDDGPVAPVLKQALAGLP